MLVLVLVIGLLLTPPVLKALGEMPQRQCDEAFLGGDERTSPHVQADGWRWWPPGMRCVVTPQDGEPRVERLPLF